MNELRETNKRFYQFIAGNNVYVFLCGFYQGLRAAFASHSCRCLRSSRVCNSPCQFTRYMYMKEKSVSAHAQGS